MNLALVMGIDPRTPILPADVGEPAIPFTDPQDLFTTAAARGKGVGRALIKGVYAQAQLAGSARVYWQTHETNATAMRLYDRVAEKSGFVVYRIPL